MHTRTQWYRLQFFAGGEDNYKENANYQDYGEAGFAGLDISGYDRVFFLIPGSLSSPSARYRSIDFVAKSPSHTISFLNWGHGSALRGVSPWCSGNPPDGYACPSELALDDVILVPCPAKGAKDCWFKKAMISKVYAHTGQTVKLSIVVTPPGSVKAEYTGLSFTVNFPPGATYRAGSASGPKRGLGAPTVDAAAGTVTWDDIPPVQAGSMLKFKLTFQVGAMVAAGTVLPFAPVISTGLESYRAPQSLTVRREHKMGT